LQTEAKVMMMIIIIMQYTNCVVILSNYHYKSTNLYHIIMFCVEQHKLVMS